jgi:hypothetical protein
VQDTKQSRQPSHIESCETASKRAARPDSVLFTRHHQAQSLERDANGVRLDASPGIESATEYLLRINLAQGVIRIRVRWLFSIKCMEYFLMYLATYFIRASQQRVHTVQDMAGSYLRDPGSPYVSSKTTYILVWI